MRMPSISIGKIANDHKAEAAVHLPEYPEFEDRSQPNEEQCALLMSRGSTPSLHAGLSLLNAILPG